MDDWSRFAVWWVVVSVFLPLVGFALLVVLGDVYVALAAAVVLAATVGVLYLFADYASEAL